MSGILSFKNTSRLPDIYTQCSRNYTVLLKILSNQSFLLKNLIVQLKVPELWTWLGHNFYVQISCLHRDYCTLRPSHKKGSQQSIAHYISRPTELQLQCVSDTASNSCENQQPLKHTNFVTNVTNAHFIYISIRMASSVDRNLMFPSIF